VLAGIALYAFGELADELVEGTLLPIDRFILGAIHPSSTALPGQLSLVLSELFRPPWALVLAAPFLVYLLVCRRFTLLAVVISVPIATLLVTAAIKAIFQRGRPVTAIVEEIGYSFPSGHAMGATVFYGLLGYVAWRFMTTNRRARTAIAVITAAFILGTGLARVYLHVHYPSDVLAGWAAGAFILAGTIIALETWPRRRAARAARDSDA